MRQTHDDMDALRSQLEALQARSVCSSSPNTILMMNASSPSVGNPLLDLNMPVDGPKKEASDSRTLPKPTICCIVFTSLSLAFSTRFPL